MKCSINICSLLVVCCGVCGALAIEPYLLDRRYNEVTFLMTHNSTSLRDETTPIKKVLNEIIDIIPSWLGHDQIRDAIKLITISDPNLVADQERDIAQQLHDGVRAFKLPVHLKNTDDPYSTLWVCHTLTPGQVQNIIDEVDGVLKKFIPIKIIRWWLLRPLNAFQDNPCWLDTTNVSLGYVLSQLNQWLDQHPDEVLGVYLDVNITDKKTAQKTLQFILQTSGLLNKLYRHVLGTPWPTVRTMISTGTRLVMFADCDDWAELGIVNKNLIGFGSDYAYKDLDALYADTANPKIAWGSVAADRVCIIDNYTTPLASGRVLDAQKANAYANVLKRVACYEVLTKRPVTFVMVDFYNEPNLELIQAVCAINRLRIV